MSDNRTINDEELKKLIDRVGHGYGIDGPEAYQALRELQARRSDTSQARLSEAVKVLEPFAAKADTYNEVPGIIRFNDDIELWQLEDNAGMRVDLTVGQLRAARQFLATLGEESHAG